MSTAMPVVPDFRSLLRRGDFLLGTWLTILDPVVPELIAGCGFDFLVADGEHGPVATSDLVGMLVAVRSAQVPLLYRVGANEPIRIMHALDSGASGVVIPQVRTPDDVARAVAWCRYPPVGHRGVAPRRPSNYGRATAAYLRDANAIVTCCIQIETREALESLDGILAVPGVDTVLVGPNDLAASLGHTGDIRHPEVEAAIGTVVERAAVAGIPAGTWTASAEDARQRRQQGFQWATIGVDYTFMLSAAEDMVRAIREG